MLSMKFCIVWRMNLRFSGATMQGVDLDHYREGIKRFNQGRLFLTPMCLMTSGGRHLRRQRRSFCRD